MNFIASADGFSMQFYVGEPYMTTYDEWFKLATNDRAEVGLYSGSGGCISYISKENKTDVGTTPIKEYRSIAIYLILNC
jgi:hypothetical protein